MSFPLEESIPYHILALLVLAVFYGIYLIKQWRQKRCGIQTMQIGRGKDGQTHTVETLMGIATVGIIPAQLLSIASGWSHLPANARFTGFCVGFVGDLIFLISVFCMKDSWRAGIPVKDKTELVTDGIYAYSRNPAFLSFDLQYIGLLLMYCNLLTGMFTVFAITMLHLQILQEEHYLTAAFGAEYLEYRHQVFRYLGRRKGKTGF
ncbi:MAG: isoprenylcysteine carboxylmethyltransferase family protein [Blautia sp.]|nr:isoprenylcysteine carboxylmethyltransferase family protein [Blautia sp.]MDY5031034.1 isoprenylcysteine carboxylmethyltransferase family protein [Blautia sp.]